MLYSLTLLMPALIPSWRFFDVIAPSPRIEFALLKTQQDTPVNWREFRPRPKQISITSMLKRMIFNPLWNESLFLVSCAERIMVNQSERSIQQIVTRIKAELIRNNIDASTTPYLQFRLIFISRHGNELQRTIAFTSQTYFYDAKVSV